MAKLKSGKEGRKDIPPGDDVCPVPPPVDEEPPFDRFCDLVLTGGVASGVVYPWAIVELARAYRFRNIGGTSVGAMAAALAAAAEYGRRTGYEAPFEALRRTPAALGEVLGDGRTRMFSLFQPNADGQRLMKLWGRLGRGRRGGDSPEEPGAEPSDWRRRLQSIHSVGRVLFPVVGVYWMPFILGGAAAALVFVATGIGALLLKTLFVLLGALLGLSFAVWRDVRHGLIANNLGLCKGGTLEPPSRHGDRRPALSEWLHDGIQAGAGLKSADRPLTFRDLWNAPAYPGGPAKDCGENDAPTLRAVNLQVITTNVTHGRPYRLPLADETSRLFFRREELEDYFPPVVLDGLVAASRPYAPRPHSDSDPQPGPDTAGLLQLPGADLPIVVAARLSLSFPLLFSAVPLWAIDYEAPQGQRTLKQCLFTDGGASSNFPIHLFDAALPRWPTFGLWLDRRSVYQPNETVWLPDFNGQGWGDNWNRFDPAAAVTTNGQKQPGATGAGTGNIAHATLLTGFLGAIADGAVDWRDRTSFRLPHVRNRVARLRLLAGEGGLHIAMPRRQILRMAHRYGTAAGRLIVERFAEKEGQPSQAWLEQRWVRLQLLVSGLRERMTGLATAAEWAKYTVPLTDAIQQAVHDGPIRDRGDCSQLNPAQAASLDRLLQKFEDLETELRAAEPQRRQVPEPELRLRAPL